MPETKVNGIRLYFEERGHGDPILCIHGTASSALIWGQSLEPLARLGRVIAYDRRGCFRSERPDPYDRTTVPEHADDAADLLRELDAEPAVVIGRSYGGEVGVDLTLRYPEKVRALVLLEAALLSFAPEAQAWVDSVRDKIFAAADQDIDRVGETFIRIVAGQWEAFPEPVREMFTGNGPAIVAEFRGGMLDADAGRLSTIGVPTLLVVGTDSPPVFRQVTEAMAAAIPGARTALVPGGHLINPGSPPVVEFVESVLRS